MRSIPSRRGFSSTREAHDRVPREARTRPIARVRCVRSSGDLSEAGAPMPRSTPPEPGERGPFTMQIDPALTIATDARVVWIDQDEAGETAADPRTRFVRHVAG